MSEKSSPQDQNISVTGPKNFGKWMKLTTLIKIVLVVLIIGICIGLGGGFYLWVIH